MMQRLLRERGLTDWSIATSCLRRSCLGKCSGEALAYVQPGRIWYRHGSAEDLLRIYERHVAGGKPVADLLIAEQNV